MARQPSVKYQKLTVKDLECETFKLLRPVWDDYVVDIGLAGRRGNSDPTWTQLGTSAIYRPGFSASASNEVFFEIQIPHSHAHGNDYNDDYDRAGTLANIIGAHIHWMPLTTNTGNCLWQLDSWHSKRGTAYSDDDVVVSQALVAASGVVTEQINSLAGLVATNIEDSDIIVCRLARIGGDETDTFTGVALAMSIDFHILRARLGSQSEFGDN